MAFQPHTPQSPSQFSPATSEPLSGMNSSVTSMTTALPTPAHSVNGSASQPSDMMHDLLMGDESPQKRKRPLDDIGERDRKKVHLGDGSFERESSREDGKFGIDDLHLDVGAKYLLCKAPRVLSHPRMQEDLFEMYGLAGLASEVAREKPNGEKNALRKTYKGHIKRLGIPGHFDAQKFDPEKDAAKESFFHMLNFPELEWSVHEVKGKEITDGLSEQTLANLSKATSMAKGRVVSKAWDASVLGDLAVAAENGKQSASAKPTAPSTPAATTPAAGARSKPQQQTQAAAAAGQAQESGRPQRVGKKRSYGDSSFEGYGEDDTGMDTGYSSGGADDRTGQKRRKKVAGKGQAQYSTTTPIPRQSYGPGVVGA